MSIRISCRDCGAEYPVSDEMAGRTVRCRECDARVDVPDDDEPLPRRSRKRAKKSDNSTMILLIVGGVLCLACVFCSGAGIVGYFFVSKVGEAVNEQLNAGMIPPAKGRNILTQQGVLMPNDPIRDNHLHKAVQITLQQGKTYVFDLRSNDMDAYLLLYDPTNILVAEDDDGGGMLNSRIRFTANRSGRYTIGCGALGGVHPGGSRFTLTVSEE